MTVQINPMIDTIQARRSIGNLVLPMPTDDELSIALRAAMSAPDHKQLKPWRFTVLTNNALIEFGKVLLKAQQASCTKPLDDMTCQKLLNMPQRAPMIIAVATDIKEHEKVPSFEQILSVGAAVQNLLLAFESLGYHTVWRTGLLSNAPPVKTYFKVADKDMICGFVYVGSSSVNMPARCEMDLNEFVKYYR